MDACIVHFNYCVQETSYNTNYSSIIICTFMY